MATRIQDLLPDWAQPRQSLVNVTAVPQLCAKADPTRWYIGFASSGLNPVTVGILSNLTVGNGPQPSNAAQLLEFWFRRHGSLVNAEWYCVAGGATTLVVLEAFYNPQWR
jgi:hypothetical protein